MTEKTEATDALTQATTSIAWVILLNKPFYPLYVWWLVGSGVKASLGTLLGMPFFLAIPLLARRRPLIARLALPIVGTFDTLFETKLFGSASGTMLFLAPCMMLAALSFKPNEAWWQRGAVAVVFLAFVLARNGLDPPLHPWSAAELSTLFALNAFAVASLTAFIGLRYAGIRR
jgi:hypothetical protein